MALDGTGHQPRAVTDRLRRQLLSRLHLGTLAVGDRLPSLRELGSQLGAGLRAVRAAYRALAAEGLVELRPRSGTFVGASGPADELPAAATWLVDALVQGLDGGVAPAERLRQVRACFEAVPLRAACVECNDDQLHALCSQVHDDYGYQARAVDLDGGARGLPRGGEIDLVLTTRFHVPEATELARRWRCPIVVATLGQVFYDTIRGLLAQGPLWWVCTDPRFAAKLPRIFPDGRFTPVVLGRDRLQLVPSQATVYATRRAAELLPPGWRGGRVVTVQRAFSTETARALLAFRVGRSLETQPPPPRRSR